MSEAAASAPSSLPHWRGRAVPLLLCASGRSFGGTPRWEVRGVEQAPLPAQAVTCSAFLGPAQLRLGGLGWEESRLSGDLGEGGKTFREGKAGQVRGKLPGETSPLGVWAPGRLSDPPWSHVGCPHSCLLWHFFLAPGCPCRLVERGLASPLLPEAPRTASWALNSWVWEPRAGEGPRAVTHSTQPVGVVCSLR